MFSHFRRMSLLPESKTDSLLTRVLMCQKKHIKTFRFVLVFVSCFFYALTLFLFIISFLGNYIQTGSETSQEQCRPAEAPSSGGMPPSDGSEIADQDNVKVYILPTAVCFPLF